MPPSRLPWRCQSKGMGWGRWKRTTAEEQWWAPASMRCRNPQHIPGLIQLNKPRLGEGWRLWCNQKRGFMGRTEPSKGEQGGCETSRNWPFIYSLACLSINLQLSFQDRDELGHISPYSSSSSSPGAQVSEEQLTPTRGKARKEKTEGSREVKKEKRSSVRSKKNLHGTGTGASTHPADVEQSSVDVAPSPGKPIRWERKESHLTKWMAVPMGCWAVSPQPSSSSSRWHVPNIRSVFCNCQAEQLPVDRACPWPGWAEGTLHLLGAGPVWPDNEFWGAGDKATVPAALQGYLCVSHHQPGPTVRLLRHCPPVCFPLYLEQGLPTVPPMTTSHHFTSPLAWVYLSTPVSHPAWSWEPLLLRVMVSCPGWSIS